MFLDAPLLATMTGHVVRFHFKQPDEPDALPPPDAIVVAPSTFNTTCKWAHGSSDTLALGLLNEAIGLRLPIVACPSPNIALARHPAFVESVDRLRSWGVTILFDPEVYPLPTPNMGTSARDLFPWRDVEVTMSSIRNMV